MAVGDAEDEAGDVGDEEGHGDDDAVAFEVFVDAFVAVDGELVA